jgi:hypothetical protein
MRTSICLVMTITDASPDLERSIDSIVASIPLSDCCLTFAGALNDRVAKIESLVKQRSIQCRVFLDGHSNPLSLAESFERARHTSSSDYFLLLGQHDTIRGNLSTEINAL